MHKYICVREYICVLEYICVREYICVHNMLCVRSTFVCVADVGLVVVCGLCGLRLCG